MRVVRAILNILGILTALLLSVVLAAVLICTPVVSASSALMQTETIRTVVDNIDFSDLLVSEDGVADSMDGLDAEVIEALLESTMVKETVDLYIDGMFAVLEGKAETIDLTVEEINAIGQAHLDELIPLVEAMVEAEMKEQIDSGQLEGEIEIPEEELHRIAGELTLAFAEGIVETFPSADDLGLDETAVQAVTMLRSGVILTGMTIAAAVLSLLILLCRWVRFKGFMWLGVVYLLCALGTFSMASAVKGSLIRQMLLDMIPVGAGMVNPLLAALSAPMMKCAVVMLLLAVAFIAIFAAGRVWLRKKKQTVHVQEETEVI